MRGTLQIIHDRISENHYDTRRDLTRGEIEELVADATESPSSFNIQHWRFVAVTEPEVKLALAAAAYGQKKVAEAAATIVVLGDLRGHERLRDILSRSVNAGTMSAEVASQWVNMADGMYGSNPAFARDEAVRSGSLAAMTLMLAAQARGLASGPMIGFDATRVCNLLSIEDRYLPVMLITVGYPAGTSVGRKPRLTVDEVLCFNSGQSLPTQGH